MDPKDFENFTLLRKLLITFGLHLSSSLCLSKSTYIGQEFLKTSLHTWVFFYKMDQLFNIEV